MTFIASQAGEATTVLMIRHADVHNPDNVVYGRLPRFRLSEAGRRQVGALACALAGMRVVTIYTSPMLRARQTANALASALGSDSPRRSSLLTEVRTSYQGHANSSLTPKMNFYDTPASPDDETIPMVARRMRRFLDQTRRRHPCEIVIAVSHADPIMILRAEVLGLPLVIKSIQGKYYPAKCSLMQFSFVEGSDSPVVVYRELIVDDTKPKPKRRRESSSAQTLNGAVP